MREGTALDRPWQRLLAATIVPATVAAGIGATLLAIGAGVEPAAAIVPVALGALGVVALVERALPWHRDWNRSRGDVLTDVFYLPVQQTLVALCAPLAATAGIAGAGLLTQWSGGGIWPVAWPVAAQVVLATVVRELFDYWAHRAMHRVDWLWRLHATHHSPDRVYFLNGVRAHPLEIAFRFGLVGVIPLAVLGVGQEVLVLTTVAALCADVFQHANIALRLGPLSWIYSIGDAHRWHHSRTRAEADTNYGNVYLFWDAVFGTRYLPDDREPPTDAGIDDPPAFPSDLLGQWLAPFRWSRLAQEASRDSAQRGR